MRIASPLALAVLLAAPAAGEEINRIVLRVNDRIATLREYEERRESRLAAISAAAELSVEERRRLAADAGRSTLRELFEELLVLSRAQQLRIEATPAKIDRAVDQARRRFGIETDEEFAYALASSGGTMAEFRERMARNILFSEVVQREVTPRVKVDDEEAARYWREHAEEFVVPERRQVEEAVVRDDTARSPAERAELARRIRDALIAGGTVAEAVRELDGESDVLVLDHEWIERGTLDPQLEAAVWELAAGGVAGPLPARGGLHVLHLLAVEPPSQQPLESVRPQILARLQEAQFDVKSREFLDELARAAYVVERLPEDAAGYRDVVSAERDPVRELLRGAAPEVAPDAAPEPPTPEPDAAAPSPPPAA
jgi:parvulin-like peptidyl-prolyl isomerase